MDNLHDYLHRVHYYETDKMGVTHHSNYVRWMEEARVDFLDQIGCGYAAMEAAGVVSPVVGLECRYLRPTVFDETVRIRVRVKEYRGVRLFFSYEMQNAAGEPVFTGVSEHCFLSAAGRPIILKKQLPDADRALREALEEDK